jgi:hypothetical protein
MRLVKLLTLFLGLLIVPAAARGADCSSAPGDADGDGVCDAHDPCWSFDGYELREPTLKLRRLGEPAENDGLRLRATLAVPAHVTIDPAATGLRILLLDGDWQSDDVMLDLVAAPGAEWTASASGTSWTYRASAGWTSDVKRAVVKEIVPNPAYVAPKQYALSIDARRGTYDATSDLESHVLMVAFAADGVTDQCAVRPFYPWLFTEGPGGEPIEPFEAADWMPACKFRGNGRSLDCTSGPRVGPCRVSMPNDMLLCDVQNAAAAQPQYRAATGGYYDGPCEGLPGFAGSPGVTCTATGNAEGFAIHASAPDATYLGGCTWQSGDPPTLICS